MSYRDYNELMRDLSSASDVMEFPVMPKSVETDSRGSYLPSFCNINSTIK